MPATRIHVFLSSLLGAAAILVSLLSPTADAAAPPLKVVHYHGYRVVVPANWPVYALNAQPGVCVRFNRHAVYLGSPGSDQRCPVAAAGRTEAILIEPLSGPRPLAGSDQRAGYLSDRIHGVAVTVTWNRDPSVIARALGVRAVGGLTGAAARHPAAWRTDYAVRDAGAAATPGEIYTGTAFDACSTPSSAKMAAWGASRFRAIGVYIGGTNMACSQPNLTASWVVQQSLRGWHLIPIYVGLQAPRSSCGCAAISPRAAARQGRAAAADAVAQAQAIDLGPGNPIYYDMEAYARNRRSTRTVLAFLQAWTEGLHAAGYKSGIYSSEYSGIEDLAGHVGTGYAEPDDVWIANWNGARSTLDPNLPSTDWADHQRIHQFAAAHNERHGHATINIDSDFVDAATAAAGSATATVVAVTAPAVPAATPALSATAAGVARPHPHTARRHAQWRRGHRHHPAHRARHRDTVT